MKIHELKQLKIPSTASHIGRDETGNIVGYVQNDKWVPFAVKMLESERPATPKISVDSKHSRLEQVMTPAGMREPKEQSGPF
jgi:hypothetical protein